MIVFVHGVPETEALWDRIRSLTDRETAAVSLPGFGCPLPDGFEPTKDRYAEWLAAELAAFGEPVDLVGHDWGAGLTFRIATAHPEVLRSWVADVGNIAHPDYVWHDFAQIWQTPEVGEAFFEAQSAAPVADRAVVYASMGMPIEDATAMAEAGDDTMARCILGLYRSAVPNLAATWGDRFAPTSAPGLVIHPTADPFGDETMATEVADMLGARFATLSGLGHWWAVEDPAASLAVLEEFWDAQIP